VELDLRGRLLALRVTPPATGAAQPPGGVNWTALFAAAHLGSPDAFTPVAPLWWPESAADAREAREGLYGGQQVRVEAAARAGAAWAILAAVMTGYGYLLLQASRPTTMHPLVMIAMAAVFTLLFVWLLWRHGALALTVALSVNMLLDPGPWTLDLSRWYAWRGAFVVAAIAALAFWGFRNALGRQSAFPASALDG